MITALASLTSYMYWLAHQNRLVQHSFTIGEDLQLKELRLFFISDIHRRRLKKKWIRQLAETSYDAVIIGGDLAESGVPLGRVDYNVSQLAALGPLFYVWGNNDQEVGRAAIRDILSKYNGVILEDASCPLTADGLWVICGTEDPSNGPVNIEAAAASCKHARHIVFVSHNPSAFQKIRQYIAPAICLAGHTHGGQIRLGKWGLQDPGTFQIDGQGATLISNGFGTTMLPLRLGAKPECHSIQIHYSASK